MCFSNLPIEFDDEGNPSLAAEAEGVDRPSAARDGHSSACSRADGPDDVPIDEADPEATYEELLKTMPREVRERLADSDERSDSTAQYGRSKSSHTDRDT